MRRVEGWGEGCVGLRGGRLKAGIYIRGGASRVFRVGVQFWVGRLDRLVSAVRSMLNQQLR
jgi:hypothetical protein